MNSLSIAISPCPNDTYSFEALLHQPSLFPVNLCPSFYDIDILNKLALEEAFPIIKTSAALYPHIQHKYRYIRSGAAFSMNGGPIVISKNRNLDLSKDLGKLRLATPGVHTSAHAVFSYLFRLKFDTTQIAYNEIAKAVAKDYDLGILIHEARTTFQDEFPDMLFPLADLHQLYRQRTQSYMPLGLIMVHRSIPDEIACGFEKALSISIEIAMRRKNLITSFISQHASSFSKSAIEHHIKLYVNKETQWMSSDAEKSINLFFERINPYMP